MTADLSTQEAVTWICLTVAAGFAALSTTVAIALDAGVVALAVAIGLPLLVLGGVLAHDIEENGVAAGVSE